MRTFNTISNFNSTLSPDSQIPVVNLKQFKSYHLDNPQSTSYEKFVADIESAKHIISGYTVIGYMLNMKKNPKCIEVYFDGSIYINHINKSCARLCNDGHIRANYQNRSYLIERLILTGKAVMRDELPIRFPKGLVVNVLDGSGSFNTAKKLGIDQDFRPENLEWTTNSRNIVHGKKINTMYKLGLPEGPVRFSANDTELLDLLDLKDIDAVKKYWEQNYKGGEHHVG